MTCVKLLVFLYVIQLSSSDWVSEWLAPIQDQFEESPEKMRRSSIGSNLKRFEDEYEKMAPMIDESENVYKNGMGPLPSGLKLKLETTLENAKMLAESLRKEIADITAKENSLKDIIVNGRNGLSTLTVTTIGQQPRSYLIRDSVWSLCTGMVQSSTLVERNKFYGKEPVPRCFGLEVTTKPDPCVFNSIIKYEIIPSRRRLQYIEDDYLCLRPTFNDTLEQYMSVPKGLVNETCTNGLARSLDDNMMECGLRILSEYSYYPYKGYNNPEFPMEYCVESDGACKLLVAWHVSNSTIENFEFLKNEPSFKKYFIKSDSIEQTL